MADSSDVEEEGTKEEQAHKGDRLRDGRYIPYSGGTMGWYEQTGIAKSEMSNGYLFHTAVDADVFHAKRFQRSGTVQDKRAAPRITVRSEATIKLEWGGQSHPARVKDMSAQGLRVQILDDVTINRGDTISARIGEIEGEEGQPALVLETTVIWTEKTGKIRTIWNAGLSFARVGPEEEQRLKRLLGVRQG